VERVAPLPTAVDTPIQVVWPKDPRHANITAVLLLPNSLEPVPCRWNPIVRLFAAIDGGPTTALGTATRRMLTRDGRTYPVWDIDNVDISAALQGRSIDFWLDVDGVTTHATRWTYTTAPAAPPTPTTAPETESTTDQPASSAAPTPPQTWQQSPTSSCQ
jgi:hypothetical protein